MVRVIRIFIPTEKDNSDSVVANAQRVLSNKYGGATTYPDCTGSWIDSDGVMLFESVTVIETVTVSEGFDPEHLSALLDTIKEWLGEEQILSYVTTISTYMA